MFQKSELGWRLHCIRRRKKLAVKEMAKITGLQYSSYKAVESGLNNVSGSTFLKIIQNLNVRPSEIMCPYVEADKYVLLQEFSDYVNSLSEEERRIVNPLISSLAETLPHFAEAKEDE